MRIKDIMKSRKGARTPITIDEGESITNAASLMKENNLHPDVKKQTEQCIQKLKRTSV